MNMIEMVFTIIGAVVSAVAAVAGLAAWIYRQGEAAGEEKARRAEDKATLEALTREVAEIRAEIAAISSQARRRRA